MIVICVVFFLYDMVNFEQKTVKLYLVFMLIIILDGIPTRENYVQNYYAMQLLQKSTRESPCL